MANSIDRHQFVCIQFYAIHSICHMHITMISLSKYLDTRWNKVIWFPIKIFKHINFKVTYGIHHRKTMCTMSCTTTCTTTCTGWRINCIHIFLCIIYYHEKRRNRRCSNDETEMICFSFIIYFSVCRHTNVNHRTLLYNIYGYVNGLRVQRTVFC